MENDFLKLIKKYLDNLEPLEPIATGATPNLTTLDSQTKAVIFDIYGTLLISASGDIDKDVLSIQNLREAFEAGGFEINGSDETSTLHAILENFHQEILKWHQTEKAKGIPYPEIEVVEVWQRVVERSTKNEIVGVDDSSNLKAMAVIFELLSNKVWPMPGLKSVLEKLSQNNMSLGIISNAQFYTPIILNYFLSGELTQSEEITFFDPALMVYSYKMLKAKPDRALFKKMKSLLEDKYGFEPEEVLYIGNDMFKDVWPAQQLGFKTVLFAGDKRSLKLHKEKSELSDIIPDFVITDLEQLHSIIQI